MQSKVLRLGCMTGLAIPSREPLRLETLSYKIVCFGGPLPQPDARPEIFTAGTATVSGCKTCKAQLPRGAEAGASATPRAKLDRRSTPSFAKPWLHALAILTRSKMSDLPPDCRAGAYHEQ